MRRKHLEILYHVTARENVPSILAQGILANDRGLIFTITDPRLAEGIAITQIFELAYAVIRVRPEGIRGRVTDDRVAEFSAPWHRVVRQPRIAPEFLELVGEYRTELPPPTDAELRLWELTGRSRAECIENTRRLFEACRECRRVQAEPKWRNEDEHAGGGTKRRARTSSQHGRSSCIKESSDGRRKRDVLR